jgi:hypothetical protein
LGDRDRAVMDEVREVLAKHGALGRFGLTLLHSHFEVAHDEVLAESAASCTASGSAAVTDADPGTRRPGSPQVGRGMARDVPPREDHPRRRLP